MFSNVWYYLVMISNIPSNTVYTPEQVAGMLQLSKNTVYDLIGRGDIVAKRIGKVYRVPASSLAFMFTGLDADLYSAEQVDKQSLPNIQAEIAAVRAKL